MQSCVFWYSVWFTSEGIGPVGGGPDDVEGTVVDVPDLDLVMAGVGGPAGAVADAAALASVLGATCMVV